MNKSSHILAAFALAGLCAASGCALVPFPVSRTLPDPIREIEVVQNDTGQPVSNAEIVLYADRFTNWLRSFPPFFASAFTPPSDTSIVIPLNQEASGHFTPERKHVWGCVRPWGLGPLGTCMYEDYEVTVSTRAEGFKPVSVSYFPGAGFRPVVGSPPGVDIVQFPRLMTNGTLLVFLVGEKAHPEATTNGSRPIPSETNQKSSAPGSGQ